MISGRSSLEYRLTIFVGLGMTLFALLIGVGTYDYVVDTEVNNALILEDQLARTVLSQASVGVYAKNILISQDVIQALMVNPLILAVQVSSHDGFLVEQNKTPGLDVTKAVIHPLPSPVNAAESIGSLLVLLDFPAIHRGATQKSLSYAGVMVAQSVVATMIVLILVHTLLVKPVTRLAKRMGAIKPGHGDRLPIDDHSRDDEILLLARSANVLLDAAEESIALERQLRQQLAEINHKLQETLQVAEQATRSKGLFLANMSHEIRTPMNGVVGMIDLALNTPMSETGRDYLSQAKKSSRHLLRVIQDILDFSRLEERGITLESLEFDLDTLLRDAMDMCRWGAVGKDIQLILVSPPEPLGIVIGDPFRLQQIMINLIDNALKFTEAGEVILRAGVLERLGDKIKLLFSVQDTGLGISREYQDKIFSSFTQADESITRKYGGSGLGLSICQSLVTLMDGAMCLESEPGRGSIFYFTVTLGCGSEPVPRVLPRESHRLEIDVPLFDRETSANASSPSLSRIRALVRRAVSGARVLLVDDQAVNRLVATKMLENVGLVVETAETGLGAVNRVKSQHYDLVLMDLQMPEMDGLTATRCIRGEACGANPPILAMSAHVTGEDRRKCLEAGLNDLISKPIDQEHLFRVLLRWMGPRNQEVQGVANSERRAFSFPGIDLTIALSRVNQDWRLLRTVFADFRSQYAEAGEQIDHWLASGHPDDVLAAERLLHALRGIAGNLATPDLLAIAETFEAALRSRDTGRWPVLLHAFRNTLTVVLGSMAHWERQMAQRVGAAGTVSDVRLAVDCLSAVTYIEQLQVLLQARDVRAQTVFSILKPLLINQIFSRIWLDRLHSIDYYVDHFDFSKALAVWMTVLPELTLLEQGEQR
ncbi:MAG: response regulator [Magnetococcales bacterium]|nr:response regulator [Magnetococcales bacterium]